MSVPRSRSRSQSPTVDVDSEVERPSSSPSPPLRAVNEECHKSTNAVFIKRWYRGSNTCSRCDFEFMPLHGSRLAGKRSEQQGKSVSGSQNVSRTVSNASKSSDEKRVLECRKEEKLSPVLKKKPPPDIPSGDAQISSILTHSGQNLLAYGASQLMPPFVPDSPAWRAYMMMHDPTPALRQLSEYARPHMGGKQELLGDPLGRLMGENPVANLQLSRERLEELERRKDPLRNETKLIPGWPLSSSPPSSARLLPPGLGNPFELQLAELQRLYSAAAGVGSVPPLPPGWCHPQNLAADLMQRERLEQLANMNSALTAVDSAISGRIPVVDRPSVPADTLFRLQTAAAANTLGLTGAGASYVGDNAAACAGTAAAELSHTHTHSHTHLHLHQPDPAAAAAASIFPPYHPLLAAAATSPFLPNSGFSLPGAAATSPASVPYVHPAAAAYGLTAGPQLGAAAQEQEMMYRELLSRMQYNTDPVLAQQLLAAQAAAQQDAIQRLDLARLHGNSLPR